MNSPCLKNCFYLLHQESFDKLAKGTASLTSMFRLEESQIFLYLVDMRFHVNF